MSSETVIADVTVSTPLGDTWTFTVVDAHEQRPQAPHPHRDRFYVQTWRRDSDATIGGPIGSDDALIYVCDFAYREAVTEYIGRRVSELLGTELAESEPGE